MQAVRGRLLQLPHPQRKRHLQPRHPQNPGSQSAAFRGIQITAVPEPALARPARLQIGAVRCRSEGTANSKSRLPQLFRPVMSSRV